MSDFILKFLNRFSSVLVYQISQNVLKTAISLVVFQGKYAGDVNMSILNNRCVANFFSIPLCQILLKSINVCRNYNDANTLFGTQCMAEDVTKM